MNMYRFELKYPLTIIQHNDIVVLWLYQRYSPMVYCLPECIFPRGLRLWRASEFPRIGRPY
jgi:hypothetical protein